MATKKKTLSAAFQRILEALAQLSEDDINKLLDGGYSIKLRLVRVRSKEEPSLIPTELDVPAIVAKLTEFPSRNDAQRFLDEQFGSRKLLEPIARSLDIPIMTQDKIDVLRDRIIEATVGARMRSQAIQGDNAKSV